LIEWAKYTNEHHPETKWFFHYEGNQIGDWKTAWYAALVRAGLRTKDENGKWVNEVRFHDTRRHVMLPRSTAKLAFPDQDQTINNPWVMSPKA